jgi:hypothetical protein
MFKLSDPGRGLLEQTKVLRFRLKFALYKKVKKRRLGDRELGHLSQTVSDSMVEFEKIVQHAQ